MIIGAALVYGMGVDNREAKELDGVAVRFVDPFDNQLLDGVRHCRAASGA